MRAADRYDHLEPATRARTVLAACDRVEVREHAGAGIAASDHRHAAAERGVESAVAVTCPAAPVAAIWDVGRTLYLVLRPEGRLPQGPVRLSCRAGVPGLGVLVLIGEAGAAVPLAAVPALRQVVSARPEILRERLPGVSAEDRASLSVVGFTAAAVKLLMPATVRRRAHVVPLAPSVFRAGAADPWVLLGERAARHLEDCHQAELRLLAARALGRRLPADAPEAVVVRRIRTDRIECGALDPDGVTAVTEFFGEDLRTPADLARWLRDASTRRAR